MKKVIGILILVLSGLTACGTQAEPTPQVLEAEPQFVQLTPTPTPTLQTSVDEAAPAPEAADEAVQPVSPVQVQSANSPVATPTPAAGAAGGGSGDNPLPGTEDLVAEAKRLLAEMPSVQVAESEITLQSIESRDWADTSLGCPEEGGMYAQVITPGYLITLEANNSEYEFHSNTTDLVVPCFDGP